MWLLLNPWTTLINCTRRGGTANRGNSAGRCAKWQIVDLLLWGNTLICMIICPNREANLSAPGIGLITSRSYQVINYVSLAFTRPEAFKVKRRRRGALTRRLHCELNSFENQSFPPHSHHLTSSPYRLTTRSRLHPAYLLKIAASAILGLEIQNLFSINSEASWKPTTFPDDGRSFRRPLLGHFLLLCALMPTTTTTHHPVGSSC